LLGKYWSTYHCWPHTTALMKFDPLTFLNGGKHPNHRSNPFVVMICYITFYFQIHHFKHYGNINFENSYLIEILFKWNYSNLFIFKISIMYIITFISFWNFKIIWTKKNWISLFNNISMTILLKEKEFNKWNFFVNIIILPMLNLFSIIIWLFSLI
jgi:hypothetical protein